MNSGRSASRNSWLGLPLQRKLFMDHPRWRRLFLALGTLLILLWQMGFVQAQGQLDRTYRNQAACGQDWSRQLVFYYHTGLFPVNTTIPVIPNSREGIWKLIRESPRSIYTWANLERLPIYFHYLDALILGNPQGCYFKITTAAAFTLTLIILFVCFWWARLELLGLFMVIFIGSNPYELYEVYTNPNIFGWPMMIGLCVLAIYLPILAKTPLPSWYLRIASLAAGFLTGTSRHIRPEGMAMILSAAAASGLAHGKPWWRRTLAVVLCAASFYGGMKGWELFFIHQHKRTNEILARYGVPVDRDAARVIYHPHWQGFLCGLGDFDTRYGYLWDDRVSYAVANAYGLPFDESCKKKIFTDIRKDPGWYLMILSKRAWRIFTQNTPPRISLGAWWWTLPFPGILVPVFSLLLLLAGILHREYRLFNIFIFTFPLGMAAFTMFSGYGISYNSISHLALLAILLSLLAEGFLAIAYRRRRSSAGGHP